jgi:hypothetical protein
MAKGVQYISTSSLARPFYNDCNAPFLPEQGDVCVESNFISFLSLSLKKVAQPYFHSLSL